MQVIKIKISKERSIAWIQKLCYSVLIPTFLLLTLQKKDADNVIVLLVYKKDSIELIYGNSYKKPYYSIQVNLMINYKK